jgi:hypothetical protein
MIARDMKKKAPPKHALTTAIVVFVLLLAVPIYIGIVLHHTSSDLTQQISIQQETLSDLAAHAIQSKLDHLESIATSIAALPTMRNDMAAGDWNGASAYARDLFNNVKYYDTYIDRIGIIDQTGIQQAAYPELEGGIGRSVASSSWYQLLQAGDAVAISNVTKRISSPQILIVSIGAPVVENNNIVGYVTLQIPTDNFLEFEQVISLGAYGFGYVVDQNGNVVAHPRYTSDSGDVVNLSTLPEVAAAKLGQDGILIEPISGELSVVTYKPVPNYGWGLVTEEPYNEAFGVRDSIINSFVGEIFAALIIDFLLAWCLYVLLNKRK